MELILTRINKYNHSTLGELYLDGNKLMDTLEDTDRGLSSDMPLQSIQDKKIYGNTAIPTGRYKIAMGIVSPKFKDRAWAKPWEGKLPRLLDVPGYEGVLIHVGNSSEDTLGCILVGQKYDGGLINSTVNFNKLMKILTECNEDIYITIK